jgi:threonine aldolase
LLCLENTIGGQVLSADYLREVTSLACRRGLATHLDGARLFNAAVHAGGDPYEQARRIAEPFDTVSVCFSKGLGAPVGSALVGPQNVIEAARRWRKMLGGGMRQSGVLAAAALHALDAHVLRLQDDHRLAHRLADGLAGCRELSVEPPQTNIVFADIRDELRPALIEHLRRRGVLATGLPRLRFVTHLNVDAADIDAAVAAVREHLHA